MQASDDDDPRVADGPDLDLRVAVPAMMEAAWREPGFCVPNQATYPHQWLWDSCFHAVIWSTLGSERGVAEIASLLQRQVGDGFVPHMTYWAQPELHAGFWRRSGASSITQPPMYGHAIAEVVRAGLSVPDDLVGRARRGLLNLGRRRRTGNGLVPVFHPWETGCDDSARWDSWLPDRASGVPAGKRARLRAWRQFKDELVSTLVVGDEGQALDNPAFRAGSIGFNALLAWNAAEFLTAVETTGQADQNGDDALRRLIDELTGAVIGRWDGDRWVDDGPPSGRTRTLDAMTALLVDPRSDGFAALLDPAAYGAPFGPRGVHRDEVTYDPATYWRGPAWPQLGYLMMVAAERAGQVDVAITLAEQLAAGARRSGLAEYWNPDTGQGLGATPQTWTGLGLVALTRLA